VEFEVESSSDLDIKLRIPAWAPSYEIQPACSEAKLEKGYLTLPAAWVSSNPKFTLDIPLKPRWLAQHPLTGQNTLSLARGPVVYCVEDYDNSWVDDHFNSIHITREGSLSEEAVVDKTTNDHYVAVTLKNGAKKIDGQKLKAYPALEADGFDQIVKGADVVSELNFVPYYFRANRKGKGHMRVGLKRCTC
jgi:DUF1680 family protein